MRSTKRDDGKRSGATRTGNRARFIRAPTGWSGRKTGRPRLRRSAKYARLQNGGANPFIDPGTRTVEAEISDAMGRAIVAEQSARQP
jgi:hypothetical protein